MGRRVKEFVETSRPCQATQRRTGTELIKQTPYPEGPWQVLHCDCKGLMGGMWYLHELNLQYSKFSMVTVHQTTSWESLKLALDETFTCHRIPEVVTGGREMEEYCERMGFRRHIITPEDAQANGFPEAFMKVLVKVVHMTVVERRGPKEAVNQYLMAYRATPHRMTGKNPAELMFERQIQTKLPRLHLRIKERWHRKQRRRMWKKGGNRKYMQMPRGAPRRRQ